jgi:hypothetical protein
MEAAGGQLSLQRRVLRLDHRRLPEPLVGKPRRRCWPPPAVGGQTGVDDVLPAVTGPGDRTGHVGQVVELCGSPHGR